MFNNFQTHFQRSGIGDGPHRFGAHLSLGPSDKTQIGLDAGAYLNFSRSFKTDATHEVLSLAATENQYEATLPSSCLSPREIEVLLWAGRGKSAWETAQLLGLAEATIKSYIRNACGRLGVKNKTHAVAVALTLGLFRI